ncbi:hypothetical protein [Promicromonospora sukumoe]|uniref:Restriction endonuclease n=1 Tax=Promicromonospora sukumoe TaxID=88382 RepID=A0A7W3J4U6_9MICO|nr:hypothetical protein [Promicromonospora sukumoe]MBA8806346.1 hypothetical protein [Promicromonospora sukumoe]
MMIDWRQMGRERFDVAVERLLKAKWDAEPGATAFSPDGRGGDGGVDFQATTALGELTIYQFKYYPDGGLGVSSRKRHIRASFDQAARQCPQRWVLVVPCKLTPPERLFVEGLAGETGLRIEILDRVALDDLLAEHDGVRRYLERDPILEAVGEYQVTTAVLKDGDDLAERVRLLAARGADMDPYWAPDFRIENGVTTITPRPKSPDAPEKSPIVSQFILDPETASEDDRAAFRRSIGYGVGEPVKVPVVASKVSGPAFFSMDGPGMLAFEATKSPRLQDRFSIELRDANGVLGEHDGVVTHAGAGPEGGTLELTFYGGLTVRYLVPHHAEERGTAELHLSVDGLMVSDAVEVLRLRRSICRDARQITIRRDGEVAAAFTLDEFEDPVDDDLETIDQFVADLAALERHLGARKRMPTAFTTYDRVQARLARLVVEGCCVLVPQWLQIPMRVHHDDGTTAELGRFIASEHFMRIRQPEFEMNIAGWRVDIGPVHLISPRVRFAEQGRLLRLLESGSIDGELAPLAPAPLEPWRLTRLSEGDEQSWLAPVAWNAVGVDEHPALARIQVIEEQRGPV